jgi:hypothetical protein
LGFYDVRMSTPRRNPNLGYQRCVYLNTFFFLLQSVRNGPGDLPNFLLSGTETVPGRKAAVSVNVTTHLYLLPEL